MNKDNYITLLFKKLKGDISLEEQSTLDVWTSRSTENEKLFQQIEKDWHLTEQYEAPTDVEVDLVADFKRLQERIKQDREIIATPQDNLRVANQPIGKVVGINSRKSSSRWIGWAAAAVIALAVGFWFTSQPSSTSGSMMAVNTKYQEQKNVTLSDGTIVWLNGNSQLTYPGTFAAGDRTVHLTGEAFFDVTKSPDKPFIITTEKAKVTVLGTSFNVRAIAAEPNTEVVVKSGRVRFENTAGNQLVELTKNEKGVYDATANKIAEYTEVDLNEMAWQSGRLLFDNTPLKEVVEDLSRQFEVTINLKNTSLGNCGFTGREKTEDGVAVILDNIAHEFDMELKTLGNTSFELHGGVCKE